MFFEGRVVVVVAAGTPGRLEAVSSCGCNNFPFHSHSRPGLEGGGTVGRLRILGGSRRLPGGGIGAPPTTSDTMNCSRAFPLVLPLRHTVACGRRCCVCRLIIRCHRHMLPPGFAGCAVCQAMGTSVLLSLLALLACLPFSLSLSACRVHRCACV